MPCYHPLQASFFVRQDGKKDLRFSNVSAESFCKGNPVNLPDNLALPCGKCMGCRLERSRQWAVRCMHEASLYEDNCFLTLTYRPDTVPLDGSLVKDEFPLFMKKLRQKFSDIRIRYYMCGEYGEQFGRPHYHSCMFNFDLPDKVVWKSVNGFTLYTSSLLDKVWGKGFCSIGSLSFESAAYVARYCTKKITGSNAVEYYKGREPEFGLQSSKPGIGADWFYKWKGDCFPSDYLIVNGAMCKPPRYYDKLLEREDPVLLEKIKKQRVERASDKDDNNFRRLLDREKCQEARFKKLIRIIERNVI
nr:MAG: replication initiator protein [Microviridae sp.]